MSLELNSSGTSCVFIVPYFGKFNNYFPLFLRSCASNPSYKWIFITDDHTHYEYPKNATVLYMSFDELRTKINSKFDFPVKLPTPYKLCDYKPAFGFIFQELIRGYAFWGHCDCDLIFGNLEKILTPLLQQGFDKYFATGQLVVYKNYDENIRRFMSPLRGEKIFRQASSTEKIFVFDEDFACTKNPNAKNVHSIYLSENTNVFAEDMSMNVKTACGKIVRMRYDPQSRQIVKERYTPSRYYWYKGNVVQILLDSNNLPEIGHEFLYIHLQMRKMRTSLSNIYSDLIEIKPDRFVSRSSLPKTRGEFKCLSLFLPSRYWLDYIWKYWMIKGFNKLKKLGSTIIDWV